MRQAFPIVISGPSGVGKSTITQMLLADDPLLSYSVSVTTRPPRPGETDGEHYEFVQDDEFADLVASGELAEWACVHGGCIWNCFVPIVVILVLVVQTLIEAQCGHVHQSLPAIAPA